MSGDEPCLSIGQAIGSYRVVRQLGEGGMGEVYEVFDKELDRRAALKVVSPELARNQDVVARFQREAKAMSQLRHPGIVHVFVYGVLPHLRGAPYFIMEYLEGETLRARIQQASKQPEGRLGITYLPVVQQIAKALAAVHQRGLVHRDLKPSNVMLVADSDAPRGVRAKLLDFGIVKVLQEAAAAPSDEFEGQTQRGMILGTPLYMAPEQWKNQRTIDGKTDVYSLAVMMFLVLTGKMPFRGPDTPTLAFLHCHKAPPSLDSIDPTLPSALVELVAHMLAKDPEHRPTMEEVGTTIGQILAQPDGPRAEPTLPEPSSLVLIFDTEGDDSSGVRIPAASGKGSEHLPLIDTSSPSLPGRLIASAADSQTVPAIEELPGWEDDHVTTANVQAAATPNPPIEVPLPAPPVGRLRELSDQSLLVGSQYNLRPVFNLRAWVSTGALLVVVLLVVGVNVLRLRPAGPPPPREAVPTVAPTPAAHPEAPPVVEVTAKAHLKKDCQHMMPNASCVGSQHLTPPQQTALLGVFLHSDASLCSGDRLVLAGLPDAPRLQVPPKTMTRKARTALLHDLKELPSSLSLPAQLEVICPDP